MVQTRCGPTCAASGKRGCTMRTRDEKREYFAGGRLPANGKVHFIGIGGAGMSGIARVLLHQGRDVSGSDEIESATTIDLETRGAKVFIGHSEQNLENAETVVVSDAIDLEHNPEFVVAKNRGLPLFTRSQALASVIADRKVLAVTG